MAGTVHKKDKVLKSIGKNIRAEREIKNLTQEALAEKADISEKHLSAVENGRLDNISVGYLVDIGNALGIDFRELFD